MSLLLTNAKIRGSQFDCVQRIWTCGDERSSATQAVPGDLLTGRSL